MEMCRGGSLCLKCTGDRQISLILRGLSIFGTCKLILIAIDSQIVTLFIIKDWSLIHIHLNTYGQKCL